MNAKRTKLHKAIKEIVQEPMVNKTIRLALLQRGVIVTKETLNYNLHQMVQAGELKQIPSGVRRLVDKASAESGSVEPIQPFAFRPLRSILRCVPRRSGALIFERLPRSFNIHEL